MQHPVHGVGNVAVHGFATPWTIRPATPDQIVGGPTDLLNRNRWNKNTTVGDAGVCGGHIDDGLLIGADRHRVVAAEGAFGADVKAVGGFDDGVKADFVLKLNRHGVQ